MSIYIGNNFEDRLEALEVKNASLRKYNEYHQMVYEIDYMSDLHLDSSFYKQSMKLDDKKRPKLSNSDQTQNKRRYVNFENSSHFIL